MATSLVWITGVSRGLGHALAGSVPWSETFVVGISRRAPQQGVVDEFVQADLSTQAGWDAVRRSFKSTITATADVERAVLVHGAATVHPIGYAGETDSSAYQAAVLLNTVAPQVIGRDFLDETSTLACQRSLIMLSTGSSSGVYEGWSAYKAGKAAVDAWIEAESGLDHPNVHMLSVAPGVIDTDMQQALRTADPRSFPRQEKFLSLHREGHLLDPAPVAQRIWELVDTRAPVGPVIDLRDWR